MEEIVSELTDHILNLTLEIIHLLIGENCEVVTKISSAVLTAIINSQKQSLTCNASRPDECTKKKILEILNKIFKLLTGEVSIRSQDVTVCFSMEEWEYVEGHKNLYKDVIMEDQPPLTSLDESCDGNPPESCPLYSQDSTQEDHTIPHHNQSKNMSNVALTLKIKEEEEEVCVSGKLGYLEGHKDMMEVQPPLASQDRSSDRNTPERSQDSTQEGHTVPHPQVENCSNSNISIKKEIKVEEDENDGSSNMNPPERCPSPLHSQDSTHKGYAIPHHVQEEKVINIKIEVEDKEETAMYSQNSTRQDQKILRHDQDTERKDVKDKGKKNVNNDQQPTDDSANTVIAKQKVTSIQINTGLIEKAKKAEKQRSLTKQLEMSKVPFGKTKDGRVKRPMNAYMLWSRTHRPILRMENPKLPFKSISEKLGAQWAVLKEEDKKPFYDEAYKLKRKHEAEFPDWEYRPFIKKKRPTSDTGSSKPDARTA